MWNEVWILKVITESADEYMWAFSNPPYPDEIEEAIKRDLTEEEQEYISSKEVIRLILDK